MSFGHRKAREMFLPYADETLPLEKRRAMERHLDGCDSCREEFLRLKTGHDLAVKLGRVEKRSSSGEPGFAPAPEFSPALAEDVWASRGRRRWNGFMLRWTLAVSSPRTVAALATVVIIQALLLGFLNRDALFGTGNAAPASISGIAINNFRILDIAELPTNSHPHVTTEGYVRKVWMDAEENTLHFMLAANPEGAGPFIVCEILNPELISAPRAGNRVKVYGVARYDAQAGRQWHEVNPVLDLSVIKR